MSTHDAWLNGYVTALVPVGLTHPAKEDVQQLKASDATAVENNVIYWTVVYNL